MKTLGDILTQATSLLAGLEDTLSEIPKLPDWMTVDQILELDLGYSSTAIRMKLDGVPSRSKNAKTSEYEITLDVLCSLDKIGKTTVWKHAQTTYNSVIAIVTSLKELTQLPGAAVQTIHFATPQISYHDVPVSFDRSDVKYVIKPGELYSVEFLSKILRELNPAIFNDKTIPEVWQYVTKEQAGKKTASGHKLVELLASAQDARFLCKTSYLTISAMAGVNIREVEEILNDSSIAQVKSFGESSVKYIRNEDLPAVCNTLQERVYGHVLTQITLPQVRDLTDAVGMTAQLEQVRTANEDLARKLQAAQTKISESGRELRLLRKGKADGELTIDIGNHKIKLDPDKQYDRVYVATTLRLVHPGAFSADKAIDEVVGAVGRDGQVLGAKLAEYLVPFARGLMLISSNSTLEAVASEAGVGRTQVQLWLESTGASYIHSIPGINSFIYRDELSLMASEIQRKPVASPKTIIELRREWDAKLTELKIMPFPEVYEGLSTVGVLRYGSDVDVQQSYSVYVAAMGGFEFYSFNKLREHTPGRPDWYTFDSTLCGLEQGGLVREIVRYCTGKKGPVNMWVMKKGCAERVKKMLDAQQ